MTNLHPLTYLLHNRYMGLCSDHFVSCAARGMIAIVDNTDLQMDIFNRCVCQDILYPMQQEETLVVSRDPWKTGVIFDPTVPTSIFNAWH